VSRGSRRQIAIGGDATGALANEGHHRRAVTLGHDDDVAGRGAHGTPMTVPLSCHAPPAA
jgi:hypothetical protein